MIEESIYRKISQGSGVSFYLVDEELGSKREFYSNQMKSLGRILMFYDYKIESIVVGKERIKVKYQHERTGKRFSINISDREFRGITIKDIKMDEIVSNIATHILVNTDLDEMKDKFGYEENDDIDRDTLLKIMGMR